MKALESIAHLRQRFEAGKIGNRDAAIRLMQLVGRRLGVDKDELATSIQEIRSAPEPPPDRVAAWLSWASSMFPRQTCPCGSDADIKQCCYQRATPIVPKASSVVLPGSSTGVQLEKCYARELNDCGKPLSREHVVSKKVLAAISNARGTDDGVSVSRFGVGPERRLNPDAIATRVLCKRHNEALSPLDDVGGDFINTLRDIALILHEGRGKTLRVRKSFNGHDIERWMLKVLLGTLASRDVRYRGVRVPPIHPSPELLRVLFFGDRVLTLGSGLFFVSGANLSRDPVAGIAMTPISWQGRPTGLALLAWSFAFVFTVSLPEAGADAQILANGFYRPKQIWLGDAADARIDLDWNDGWDGPVAVAWAQRVVPSKNSTVT